MISKTELIRAAKLEKARREFWYYCKLMYPSFYKSDRKYLKKLCEKLQDFLINDNEFMLIKAPPRHGKSFSATNFIEWALGKNPTMKIMSGSYNEDLSKTFSKKIRSTIETEKINTDKIVYSDIFPNTKLKYGNSEAKKWQIEASEQINYLATSPTGTATGFGADLEVIDDLIKSDLEANNENVLEQHWDWFTNTMLSRREGKKKVLIIMTRWRTNDLAGRVTRYLEEKNIKYSDVTFKALENDKMLCDEIFNKDDFENAKQLMGESTFYANYQQEPLDMKNVLYTDLKTYTKLPTEIRAIENYTDTADTGEDYLCSIDYVVGLDNKAYIINILFTQEPMQITEPLTAEMLTNDKVNFARIESNNGGLGFSRNVERISKQQLKNSHTIFKPFHQSKNKVSRILTGSTGVMNNVYLPENWRDKFPEFYKSITRYQRIGKNAHDDSADALTGVYEVLEKRYISHKPLHNLRL